MLGIASKCLMGLLVEKQHPCVDKESEGGFSPGYVLLSFQSRTPSRGQQKADCPACNKAMPTPDRLGKILTIKEVGLR